MKILAIDPSGNFNEGKGTTGWSVFKENKTLIMCGQIRAEDYETNFAYYEAHIELIKTINPDIIVMEDFKLYANKAKNQINSRFETPKLIGIIEYYCNQNNIKLYLQGAFEVKQRWTDNLLVLNNLIQNKNNRYYGCGVQLSEHIRDSIRHGIHFITFKLKENSNDSK